MLHRASEYIAYAEKNKIPKDRVYFNPVSTFSPYMECLPDAINAIDVYEDCTIDVNPLYRYSDIFGEMMNPDNRLISDEMKKFIFDFWVHEISKLETLEGLNGFYFFASEIIKLLRTGFLQQYWQEGLNLFSEDEIDLLGSSLTKYLNGSDGYRMYRFLVSKLFTNSFIYSYNDEGILVYLGVEEHYAMAAKMKYLADLFLPVNAVVRIFWSNHFGVFDIDETMTLNEVSLL